MEDLRILVATNIVQQGALTASLNDAAWSEVEAVLGGDAAIERLGSSEYDLVIAQWRMQEGDGEKLVRWIRASEKISELPFIALVYGEEGQSRPNVVPEVFEECARAGVSDYLEVLRSGVLKKKVRTVVGARSHLMAEIYKEAEAGWDLYAKVNPDILPQEDIDALLTATDGEVADGDHCSSDLYSKGGYTPSSDSTSIVCSYDFKHPARVNKDQLRTIENLHDNYARLLSGNFSSAMRAVVDVDTAFVDQTTYAEFIMSLSNPSCSYQFTFGSSANRGLNGQAIIDIAMPVVFSFVDRTFGGKGSSQGVDARTLSQIEMGVINQILKRMVEDLEATWSPILPAEITDIELETNPEFMQISAPSEIVILLAFEVNSTNASGLISLCYPFFTLESILPLLGRQTFRRSAALDRGELAERNPKFLGWPYEEEGEVNLKLAGRIPPHLQGKYGRVDEGR